MSHRVLVNLLSALPDVQIGSLCGYLSKDCQWFEGFMVLTKDMKKKNKGLRLKTLTLCEPEGPLCFSVGSSEEEKHVVIHAQGLIHAMQLKA